MQKYSNNFLYRKYFISGLKYKLAGSFIYYLIYVFYYAGGDSCNFFAIGRTMNTHMLTMNFSEGWNMIFSMSSIKTGTYFPPSVVRDVDQYGAIYLLKDEVALIICRISSIISLLGINSYLCTGLLFSYFSYLMIFRLFVMFCELFPSRHSDFSFSFLKIYSVLFWGSHVSKDTVCMALLCLVIYYIHKIFIQLKFSAIRIFGLIISVYIVFNVKNYILVAALPGMVYWIMKSAQQRAFSGILSKLFAPIMIALAGIVVFLLYGSLSQNFQQLSSEEIEKKAEGFRSWHQTVQENKGGSGYTIGGADLDYSPSSILKHAPEAIVITLFGPFPWQARNLVMALCSLEALYFLYLFLNAMIRKGGGLRILKVLDEPVLFFCFTFIIIMATSIGLTSFNYGALVRYKIPLMPFFSVLIILLSGEKINKKKKPQLTFS